MKTVTNYIEQMVNMDREQLLALEEEFFVSKTAKAGSYIVEQGTICRSNCFLQKGCMVMVYERKGRSFIKDFIFKNNFASVHPSMVTQQPARYALKAVSDCIYQSILYDDMLKLWQKYSALKDISHKMTEHIYLNVTRRFESVITLSAEERYLELLERRPTLMSEIPLYMIASYLGITDVALSRIRNRIAKRPKFGE